MSHRTTERGFTLVELMVAVAVIGVLTAIALPALSGSSVFEKTGQAERELTSFVQRAKYEAVKNNGRVVIEFSPDRYFMFTDARPYNGVFNADEGDRSLSMNFLREGISYQSYYTETNAQGKDIVTFSPLGTVVRTNGTPMWSHLLLRDTRNRYRYIYIDYTGTIQSRWGEYGYY